MGNRPPIHLDKEMADQVQMDIEQIEQQMNEHEQQMAELKKQRAALLEQTKGPFIDRIRAFGKSSAGKILHRIIEGRGGRLVKTIQYEYFDPTGTCITLRGVLLKGEEDSGQRTVAQEMCAMIHKEHPDFCERMLAEYEEYWIKHLTINGTIASDD